MAAILSRPQCAMLENWWCIFWHNYRFHTTVLCVLILILCWILMMHLWSQEYFEWAYGIITQNDIAKPKFFIYNCIRYMLSWCWKEHPNGPVCLFVSWWHFHGQNTTAEMSTAKCVGCYNTGYPSKTLFMPISREVSFACNSFLTCPIILEFCTEQGNDTGMHGVKCQNDCPAATVMGEGDFARCGLKLIISEGFSIEQQPSLSYKGQTLLVDKYFSLCNPFHKSIFTTD